MRLLAAISISVLLVAGCGDDDTADDVGVDGTSSTSAPASGDGEDAGDGDDEVEGESSGASACATTAEATAPEVALQVFPDNPDVTWTAIAATDEGAQVVVELEPQPDEVGYSRFRFLYGCDGDEPVRLATYALEDGAFVLLATTDEAPGDLPATLP